jgi:hypothetical protein
MTDARVDERLRQERETFNQAKAHDAHWFALRLSMGFTGIIVVLCTAVVSGYVMLNPIAYRPGTVTASAYTLSVDIFGTVVSIFKLVMQQNNTTPPRPITESWLDERTLRVRSPPNPLTSPAFPGPSKKPLPPSPTPPGPNPPDPSATDLT